MLRVKHDVSFRYLEPEDFNKGLFQTLNQLTKCEPFEEKSFRQYLQIMQKSKDKYLNIVGIHKGKIIAFGTNIVTQTLEGKIGKIQNIVVCKSMRGKGLGKDVIQILREEAQKIGVHKMTLFCEQKNVEFYAKLGFFVKGTLMVNYNQ